MGPAKDRKKITKMSKFKNWSLAAIVLMSGASVAQQAAAFSIEDKILAGDGAASDNFGTSVGISGTTAIVGAFFDGDNGFLSGSAYLFDTTTGAQSAKLTASDGAAEDFFGGSVGVSGTTAIVGAQDDDDNGSGSGSAYLFDTTTGAQIFKLTAGDGAAQDGFGSRVATSGTTAIVGAYLDDDNGSSSGSAYLFDTTTGTQSAKLTASDAAAGDWFGGSVGISGTTAIVGAIRDDDNGLVSGSAYLFDTTTGTQLAKLTASDAAAGDLFGGSVAISGTTAIVGANGDDDNGTDSGSAYLFDTTTGNQLFKLTASDGAAQDRFGGSVAISGTIAIVGAAGDDDNGASSGSTYLFDTTTGAQIAKLTASDGAANDEFGYSVAIFDDIIMVGAREDDDNGTESGSAYIYSSAATVPLPAGVWLLLSGALALGWVRRRKSARA
jgi:hypothetical protein